jgi:hypothetical protein
MATPNEALIGPNTGSSIGFTWSFIGTGTARAYPLLLKAPFAFRITEVTSKCTSGTATATVSIDAVNLGGTANSVSSSEQSQTHSSANTVSAGQDVVVTLSSVTSPVDPIITVKGVRL